MTGEYNPNLQQAPQSDINTVIPDDRFRVKEGLEELDNTFTRIMKMNAKNSEAERKAQLTALETEFDKEVAEVLEKSQLDPNNSESKLEEAINEVIYKPRFAALEMSKKNSILEKRNYSHPTLPIVEASKQSSKFIADKAAKKNQDYINIAIATYGPDITKYSVEAQVDAGKRLFNTQEWTLNGLPAELDKDVSDEFKNGIASATGVQLRDKVALDLSRNIDRLSPEFLSQYKIEAMGMLMNNSNPPMPAEYASVVINQAMEPFLEVAEVIKQGREDTLKFIQQRTQISKENLEQLKSETELQQRLNTGTSAAEYSEYMKSFAVMPQEVKDRLLSIGGTLFKTADRVRLNATETGMFNTSQDTFNNLKFFFDYPLTTSAQKANVTTGVNSSLAEEYEKAKQNGEANSEEYQKTYAYNTRVLMNEIADRANEFANAFKSGDEQQIALYRETFNRNLKAAVENDLASLSNDALGIISYKDGKYSSTNTGDKYRVKELNDLLDTFRRIQKNTGVSLIDEKVLNNWIQQGIVDNALNFQGVEDTVSDLKFLNPMYSLQMGWNRLTGNKGDVAALTPRQAVKLARSKEKLKRINSENARKARMEQAFGEGTYTPEQAKGFWNWVGDITGLNQMEGEGILQIGALPLSTVGSIAEGEVAAATLVATKGSEILSKAFKDFKDWSKMDTDNKQRIKNEEGVLTRPKQGNIGYGFNLKELQKLSPEVKERLEAIEPGITSENYLDKYKSNSIEFLGKQKMDAIFDVLYEVAEEDAKAFAGTTWNDLSDARKQALIDMAYNHGREGLMLYKKVKNALIEEDYLKAAIEILNSKYGRELLKNRAKRNAALMLKGEF